MMFLPRVLTAIPSDDDDGIVVNTLSTEERFRRRCRPLDFRSWTMASSSFDHFVR
jgi:hypothetical protein